MYIYTWEKRTKHCKAGTLTQPKYLNPKTNASEPCANAGYIKERSEETHRDVVVRDKWE